MAIAIELIAMWIFSDAVYSWSLYVNAPGYEGSKRQTFKKDHWVRLVRALCAIGLMVIGGLV